MPARTLGVLCACAITCALLPAAPESGRKAEVKVVTNSIGMKLALIPAGKFMMGSPADEKERDDERQHEVRITRAFRLGVTEVTQGQYRKVMGKNPSYYSRDGGADGVKGLDTDDFPVEKVSWEEAKEFCQRLSNLPEERKKKRSYRLPTEAEWEYACRGPGATYKKYHVGDELTKDDANFGNELKRTCKVASYRANAFGLYDMHGNVEEWCSDWYGADYYSSSPAADPAGPSKGSDRVFRGGAWYYPGRFCRSANRGGSAPAIRVSSVGFRVALDPSSRE